MADRPQDLEEARKDLEKAARFFYLHGGKAIELREVTRKMNVLDQDELQQAANAINHREKYGT